METSPPSNKNTKNHTRKVLLVDDDDFLRASVADRLREDGFNTIEAINGEQGLSLALAEHPDIIILDIVMPKMDGFSVMRELRKDDWGKTAAIVVLTQFQPDDKALREIVEHRPSFYLVKSDFTISNIVEKIKERLSILPWETAK